MANDETVESRPRNITATNVWEAFDRLREDTREARHTQNNLFQRTIHEQSEAIRTEIRSEVGGMDQRLRKIEEVVIAASPVSLGGRINDLERWQSRADGDSTLPARLTALDKEIDAVRTELRGEINELKSWRDEIRGSVNFIKFGGTVLALANAAVLFWATVMGGRVL